MKNKENDDYVVGKISLYLKDKNEAKHQYLIRNGKNIGLDRCIQRLSLNIRIRNMLDI